MKTYIKLANAHIEAAKTGNFDLMEVKTKDDLRQALIDGKTVRPLLDEIEVRYTSITSIILSRHLFHQSQNYIKGVSM